MAAGLGFDVHDDGSVAVVVVHGEVDAASSPTLDSVVVDLTRADIVLDLAAVTFMGSSGLASLLRADKQAVEHGGRLTLRAPSRQVLDLLEMTHLLDRFAIEPA